MHRFISKDNDQLIRAAIERALARASAQNVQRSFMNTSSRLRMPREAVVDRLAIGIAARCG